MVDLLMGLQSFKTVFDSLNALSKIHDDNTRALAISEIIGQLSQAQGALVASQQRELTLSQEKAALEAEIVRLKDWAAEKQQYRLQEHGENKVLVYALKEANSGGAPAHCLCPDCFAQGKPSILQAERHEHGRSQSIVCHVCNWRGWTWGHAPTPQPPRRR